MIKIKVGDLHEKLVAVGIPLVSVRLTKAQTIELEFAEGVTDKQKTAAQVIVAGYDQEAEDAAKPLTVVTGITLDEINAAKTVDDLKALLIKAYTGNG